VFGSKSVSLYEVPDTIMKGGLSLPVPGSTCDLVIRIMGQQHRYACSAIVGCMFPKKCENIKISENKDKIDKQ
jgi:hypothetical protein